MSGQKSNRQGVGLAVGEEIVANRKDSSVTTSIASSAKHVNNSEERFSFRWGIPWLDEGWTQIPNFFFDFYTKAGIKRTQFLTVLHLARFKYDSPEGESRPSVSTIAKQMGYSKRGLQIVLAGLEEKGFLERHYRENLPTIYDFGGFVKAILVAAKDVDNLSNKCSRGEPQFMGGVNHSSWGGVNHSSSEEEEQQEEQTRTGVGGGPVDNPGDGSASDPLYDELLSINVAPDVATSLIREYPADQIQGWVDYARDHSGTLTNPAGLVIKKLRAGARIHHHEAETRDWHKAKTRTCSCGRAGLQADDMCPDCGKCWDCCRCEETEPLAVVEPT